MVSEKFVLDYSDVVDTAGWRDLNRLMMDEIALYGKVLEVNRPKYRELLRLIKQSIVRTKEV